MDCLIDQDATVQLTEIAAPEAVAPKVVEMFEHTLAHEREVTAHISALVDQALSEKDHATNIFLHSIPRRAPSTGSLCAPHVL